MAMQNAGESGRQIRQELARILADPDFQSSPRSGALLTHVVEKTLAGRQGEIKESTIGVEVFGRPADYDTRRDAIVRSEARRLREKLNRYSLREGTRSVVRIEVPRGSYQPEFHFREQPAPGPKPIGLLSRLRWGIAGALLTVTAVVLSAVAPRYKTESVPTLAILPFANRSDDAHLKYVSDGLAEDLERDLSRVKGLRIHAHSGLPANSAVDYRELGRRLGVTALLEGKLTGSSGHHEVWVSLIRTSNSAILWADRFPYDGSVQPEERQIESATASALGVKVWNVPAAENPQVHDLYLRGHNLTAIRRRPEMELGIALFQQALTIDPSYALAYAGIADAYGVMAANGKIDPGIALARGMPAARKAVELAPSLAEAHAALGMLKGVAGDPKGQAEEYQRTIELNPNYGRGYLRLGISRFTQGDFAGAERLIRESETLDPTSLALPLIRAELYYYWRRYDDSIALSRQIQQVDTDPRDSVPNLVMIRDFLQLHRLREAEEAARQLAKTEPPAIAKLARVACLGAQGHLDEAEQSMREVEANLKSDPVDPYSLALVFARLHDTANTLDWLEKALHDHTPDLSSARWEPALDFVRAEPRYRAVVDAVFIPSGN